MARYTHTPIEAGKNDWIVIVSELHERGFCACSAGGTTSLTLAGCLHRSLNRKWIQLARRFFLVAKQPHLPNVPSQRRPFKCHRMHTHTQRIPAHWNGKIFVRQMRKNVGSTFKAKKKWKPKWTKIFTQTHSSVPIVRANSRISRAARLGIRLHGSEAAAAAAIVVGSSPFQ